MAREPPRGAPWPWLLPLVSEKCRHACNHHYHWPSLFVQALGVATSTAMSMSTRVRSG